MINKTEIEDFNSLICDLGYKPENFELTSQENEKSNSGIYLISGMLQVRSNINGNEKSYAAGNNTSWVVSFEIDLRNGFFGKPIKN